MKPVKWLSGSGMPVILPGQYILILILFPVTFFEKKGFWSEVTRVCREITAVKLKVSALYRSGVTSFLPVEIAGKHYVWLTKAASKGVGYHIK